MLVQGNQAPVQLRNLMNTKPMYKCLFIPTSRYIEVRSRLNTQGSIEHRSIQEIKTLVKEQALHKSANEFEGR
jgi:hypothetical protein